MLLTQRQVSGLLNVSIDTVKRLRKTGQLPTIKVGRSVRIPQGAAYTLMEERQWQKKNATAPGDRCPGKLLRLLPRKRS